MDARSGGKKAKRSVAFAGLAIGVSLVAPAARAADVPADPSNYVAKLGTLKPGDTMQLAAGTYSGLALANLNGTASRWITVAGPAVSPPTAVIQAPGSGCCNVVEITDSSFLALENLSIDGNHVPSAFGVSAKGDTANHVHDIRIEDCVIVNCDNDGMSDGGQQDDGISTKTPTWNWTIRHNQIVGAGTGMYLGNSTGSDPFTAGLIENNLVVDTIGYGMEIKSQSTPRQTAPDQPTTPQTTIIRNNVWIKGDNACTPSLCRPNMLVGGFAASGPGSQDFYQIYGNFFFHNPSDQGLLQVSGKVTVHDNVMVDAPSAWGVFASDDDGVGAKLELAHVYNNTIYGVSQGIVFNNAAPMGDLVVGNLIFSATPTVGPIMNAKDNLSDGVANAAKYVNRPGTTLGSIDFYPLPGKCTGSPIDESAFSSEVAYDVDFNGTPKGSFTYRGAYAGSGKNPGWQLGNGFEDAGPEGGKDAGADAGKRGGRDGGAGDRDAAPSDAAAPDAQTPAPGSSTGTSGGCGCRQAGGRNDTPWLVLCGVIVLASLGRRRGIVSVARPTRLSRRSLSWRSVGSSLARARVRRPRRTRRAA